ncbi:MAG: hypothetical protein ACRDWH_10890 [Acidimicrobiia bacterium]
MVLAHVVIAAEKAEIPEGGWSVISPMRIVMHIAPTGGSVAPGMGALPIAGDHRSPHPLDGPGRKILRPQIFSQRWYLAMLDVVDGRYEMTAIWAETGSGWDWSNRFSIDAVTLSA